MAEVGRKANEVGIPIAERTAALAAFEVRAHGGLMGRGIVVRAPAADAEKLC